MKTEPTNIVTLREKLEEVTFKSTQKIPCVVTLIKSPRSLLALPGSISRENYNYLYALLNRNRTLQDEAFMSGFCMGNDPKTTLFQAIELLQFTKTYVILHLDVSELLGYLIIPPIHPNISSQHIPNILGSKLVCQ